VLFSNLLFVPASFTSVLHPPPPPAQPSRSAIISIKEKEIEKNTHRWSKEGKANEAQVWRDQGPKVP
jgi:hypothetical protein